eukprot:TRINITY_DN5732_c0_g1_i1.p1 TRINITY_DN5732_c0_g1~~TRINITY_DN5732_c0_g1_i1.p1  ORF type:complete len:218 (-),score=45.16 TRINITY_DN5732_c0_g1_i1:70-669(-)
MKLFFLLACVTAVYSTGCDFNGDFEAPSGTTPPGWSSLLAIEASSTVVHGGTTSARVSAVATTTATLQAGTTYSITCWVWSPVWNYNWVVYFERGTSNQVSGSVSVGQANTWVQKTAPVTYTPTTSGTANIQFNIGFASSSYGYFDDCTLNGCEDCGPTPTSPPYGSCGATSGEQFRTTGGSRHISVHNGVPQTGSRRR